MWSTNPQPSHNEIEVSAKMLLHLEDPVDGHSRKLHLAEVRVRVAIYSSLVSQSALFAGRDEVLLRKGRAWFFRRLGASDFLGDAGKVVVKGPSR